MKLCGSCAASNPDTAQFCLECGFVLSPLEPARPGNREIESVPLTHGSSMPKDERQVDLLFILDCTGSMRGELDGIRDTIMDFADANKAAGVDTRIGLLGFRDRLECEEPVVLQFDGFPFTRDPASFRREVSKLKASGGGDIPESSLDALMLGLRQPFDKDAKKVLVLVTDAPPHIPDKETAEIQTVVAEIQEAGIDLFLGVINTEDPASRVYLKLLEGTRGVFFDLGKGNDFHVRAEHFKKTLGTLGETITNTM